MSRLDHHDSDYPPGLSSYRQDQRGQDYLQDRRPSAAFSAYSTRSLALQDHRDYNNPSETNTHNPTASLAHLSGTFPPFNHHSHRPSPPLSSAAAAFASSSPTDRDSPFYRQNQASSTQASTTTTVSRSTLWWTDLEPWMDEEYVKQVCGLMNWDPASIKVPHPAPDPVTGQQSNNPGYCFLTFPSPSHAASVLAQISKGGSNGTSLTMPNSSKPFVMNWASSAMSSSPIAPGFPNTATTTTSATTGTAAQQQQQQQAQMQQYPKEYSIFVGDLAPETSNSDLVAVFRNPVLGLRNDREPKFIRPFLSCKSAKIMLDPSTGVSRGYGFVRFTDEADQQRALIEMHGLYCLSRPMRISPATAKFKAPQSIPGFDLSQVNFGSNDAQDPSQAVTIALPLPNASQAKSVSAPIAAAGSNTSLNSNGSHSVNSLSSGTASSANSLSSSAYSSDDMINMSGLYTTPGYDYSRLTLAQQEAQIRAILANQAVDPNPRYIISAESWKHHAQARAILGNLIGPNGEQLTSTDPYNTTVFVGGLSPLISEDTLRTFFVPFGDIHYVKVPVGKHCGFVQFVKKADAEKAIEKMQGFPIGGSRIRLSWGRSQYKAAQAAAQAAQAAALQTQFNPLYLPSAQTQYSSDQALEILQKSFGQGLYNTAGNTGSSRDSSEIESSLLTSYGGRNDKKEEDGGHGGSGGGGFRQVADLQRAQSSFSPFSPDPNNLYTTSGANVRRERDASPFTSLPHPSKAFAPGFFPSSQQEQHQLKVNTNNNGANSVIDRVSPTTVTAPHRPGSGLGGRYGFGNPNDTLNRASGRAEGPISRPSSGQMSLDRESDIQDLNGTLASLDLDRSWKATGA